MLRRKPDHDSILRILVDSALKRRLAHWLCESFDRDIPMLCRDKRPLHRHVDDLWTWETYTAFADTSSGQEDDIGVLLHDLCVIDVDDRETAEALETRFPILREVPRESTRKGMHYFFRRSEVADLHGYYDSVSPVIPAVDFKTRCANGTTRGFIVTAPSENKEWIASPWEVPLVSIPNDLLAAVALPHHRAVDATIKFDDGSSLDFVDDFRLPRFLTLQPIFEDTDRCDNIPVLGFSKDTFIEVMDIVARGKPRRVMTRAQLKSARDLADYLGITGKDGRHFNYQHPCSFAASMLDMAEVCPAAANVIYTNTSMVLRDIVQMKYISLGPVKPSGMTDERWLLRDRAPIYHEGQDIMYATTDLAGLAWQNLHPIVRDLLAKNRGKAMLAGGAAVGLASPHVSPGSDYDIFVFGNDARDSKDANKIVWGLISTLSSLDSSSTSGTIVAKTGSAVTVVVDETVIQIILRLYASPEDVLDAFDISVCKAGLWMDEAGDVVFKATEDWHVAMTHMFFWVDVGFAWTSSSISRIFKYYAKGFDVFIPGLRRDALLPEHRASSFRRRSKEAGMVGLIHIESNLDASARQRRIFDRTGYGGERAFGISRCWSAPPDPVIPTRQTRQTASEIDIEVRRIAYQGYASRSGYGDSLLTSVAGQPAKMIYALRHMISEGWSWLTGAEAPVRSRNEDTKGKQSIAALEAAKSAEDVEDALAASWQTHVSGTRSFFSRSPRIASMYCLRTYAEMCGITADD